MIAVQLIFYLGIPALVLFLEKRFKWIETLGPVILCYAIGIAIGNLPFFEIDLSTGKTVYEVAAILAVPLVLFSADMKSWMRLAGKTILSFACCVVAILISATTAYFLLSDQLDNAAQLAGMTVGVYTGGTPNLTSIGVALEVPEALIAKANIIDLLMCVPYLLVLFTVAQRVLLLFLPKFSPKKEKPPGDGPEGKAVAGQRPTVKGVGVSFLLACICLGTSVGLAEMLPITQKGGVIIMGVTVIGLLFSFSKSIRHLPGSYETGEYALLVFCVTIGTMIRFDLLTQNAPALMMFMGLAVYGAIAIHYLLAALFRIDADTVIVTSTAAIFSPVFVAPIARVLGNREIIPSGMTTGVIGFAVGNVLGLMISWLLG